MDPLTHLLAGLSIATLSGAPIAITSPIYIAAALGSLAPDLDCLYRMGGEISYLHQHRGLTHSLLGINVISLLLSGILYSVFPQSGIVSLFLWCLLGAASHIALDFFNPHGIQLLWPLNRTRYHRSLLNGFDPIIVIISLGNIFIKNFPSPYFSFFLFLLLPIYLGVRWKMASNILKLIKDKYGIPKKKIITMPSLFSLWSWDFLVDNGQTITAGEVRSFSHYLQVFCILKKYEDKIIKKALKLQIGKLFSDFTPYLHIILFKEDDKTILEFIDLRYRIQKKFLHSADAVFNEDEELEQANFYPFSKNRKISLVG